MTLEFAFEAMLRFLQIYVGLGEDDTQDISRVIQAIESDREAALQQWVVIAERIAK